jgi:SAM-dependent methyltransferase
MGGPAGSSEIRKAIQSKYAEVSVSAAGKFQYPVGKEGAQALGYDPAVIRAAPARFFESACGVGNPFLLGAIMPGSALLDVGCGAGFDLFVASTLVGSAGRVYGTELTEAMAIRAQENLALAGVEHFEIKKVDSDELPYRDGFFDVVISNGVINLSQNKDAAFREIYRVLKAGSRLQFADVVLEQELPANLAGSAEAWSQ